MKTRICAAMTCSGLLLLLLSACSDGGYYLQAARGHFDILNKRQAIEALLDSGELSAAERTRFEQILQIRNFASRELSLPENDSYRSFVKLDRPYPVWNVVAAPEFSLKPKTWCFPVAGCVSYRGYFSEAAAQSYAEQLHQDGYETLVAGVPAYSTLSWFDDPVLSSFSNWPLASVARLIFHELAHQELYLAGDSDFNEAFATSVELAGTRLWLLHAASDAERDLFQQQLARESAFVDWTDILHQQLEKLYSAPVSDADKRSKKQEIFAEARTSYAQLKASWGGYGGYDNWVKSLNNARLVSLQTYRRLLPAFNTLQQGTGESFSAYYKACKNLAELPAEERRRQLERLQAAPPLALKVAP